MKNRIYIPEKGSSQYKRRHRWLASLLCLMLIVSALAGAIEPSAAEETADTSYADNIYIEDGAVIDNSSSDTQFGDDWANLGSDETGSDDTQFGDDWASLNNSEYSDDAQPEEQALAETGSFALNNSISGIVWLDANENGYLDADESGIEGYEVYLYIDENIAGKTLSDEQGEYRFENVISAEYTLGIYAAAIDGTEYLLPDAALQSGEDNAFAIDPERDFGDEPVIAQTDILSMSADTRLENLNAALRSAPEQTNGEVLDEDVLLFTDAGEGLLGEAEDEQTQLWGDGTISGAVWLDADVNGLWDEGEGAVAGYSLQLYAADDLSTPLASAETDDNGEYRFDMLPENDYIIGIAMQTIGGSEFLLPLSGITADNAFAIDWNSEPITAYTSLISLTDTNTISGIKAGVRGKPQVATMDTGGKFIVTQDANAAVILGTVDSLNDAFALCTKDNTAYTITVTGDVTMSSTATLNSTTLINKNLSITIRSGSGGPYKLTMSTTGMRHIKTPTTGTSSITLRDIILDGGTVYSGGMITTQGGGGIEFSGNNFRLESGAVIQNCFGADTAMRIRAITFVMEPGVIIRNNYSTAHAGGLLLSATTAVFNGGEISGNHAGMRCGGALITADSLTINDLTVINNDSTEEGGGLYLNSVRGTTTINGGKFMNNTSGTKGGAIYGAGTIIINGGTFSGNSATCGGAIALEGFATGLELTNTMTGGIITNNTADYGGGVFINYGGLKLPDGPGYVWGKMLRFIMTGGEISGNTANYDGGGIWTGMIIAAEPSTLIYRNPIRERGMLVRSPGGYVNLGISGSAVVKDNVSRGTSIPPSNYLWMSTRTEYPTFDGTLLDNDNINYIYPGHAVTYIANNGTAEANVYQETTIMTSGPVTLYTNATDTKFSTPSGSSGLVGWNTRPDGLGTSYTEAQAITLSESLVLYADWGLRPERYLVYKDSDMTTLLSSHHWLHDAVAACGTDGAYTILATTDDPDMDDVSGANYGHVTIPADKQISLSSVSGAASAYKITALGTRHFDVQGSLSLKNIVLDGNGTTGGVIVSNGGVLNIQDQAVIQNCKMGIGAGIQCSGTVNMSGGSITGNVGSYGGGVYLSSSGKLNMTGGSITGNSASGDGGGIYTTEYDYSDPASIGKYRNIAISGTASVSGNTASVGSAAPSNANDFTTRATNPFPGTLLNNHQINYKAAYTVTYKANNSSGASYADPASYAGGASATALSYAATGFTADTGAVFEYWCTDPAGQSASGAVRYNAGGSITVTGNVTLYAIYSTDYKVTYKANNSSGATYLDPASYASGTSVTTKSYAATGFTADAGASFDYWCTDPAGQSASGAVRYNAGASFNITANTTLYAIYSMDASLSISKTVAGASGDMSKAFSFTIMFKDGSGNYLPAGTSFSVAYSGPNAPGTSSISVVGSAGTASFSLAHGQTIVISGINRAYTVTVSELNAASDGYTESWSVDGGAFVNGSSRTESMSAGSKSIVCKNTKGTVVPTGVLLDVWPYVLMVGFAAAGAAAVIVSKSRKNKRDRDDRSDASTLSL